jgi:two-component system, LytTR family, sensor kinase
MNSSLLRSVGHPHVPDVVAYDPDELKEARSRAVRQLTVIFWTASYLLSTLAIYLGGNPYWLPISGMRILSYSVGVGFCYLFHLLLKSGRLETTRSRLIALAVVAPILAELFAWANWFAGAAVDPAADFSKINWADMVRSILFWSWFFLAWAGLYLALMYGFDVHEEQCRSAELRERAHVAQLRALHSQINPHFLFNSLNSVSALILDKRSDKADEMVIKLAHFLRLGLAADPTRLITLDRELGLQKAYLEIEQLRFPDLEVEFRIDEAVREALVPSLILQPVVENAVKYGVAEAPPPAKITLSARASGNKLLLDVIDSGKGGAASSNGAGIGLANIRQRLALLYGDEESSLAVSRGPQGQFQVEIMLPLELP